MLNRDEMLSAAESAAVAEIRRLAPGNNGVIRNSFWSYTREQSAALNRFERVQLVQSRWTRRKLYLAERAARAALRERCASRFQRRCEGREAALEDYVYSMTGDIDDAPVTIYNPRG